MSSDGVLPWGALERWSSTAFLVGAAMFVAAAGFNAIDVLGGAGHTRLPLKQAFISAGWLAALFGLLGRYPALADRSRLAIRAGAVFAALGMVGFAVMGGVSLAVYQGVLAGGLESYAPAFFPLVAIGSLLPFPLFGAVSFRTGGHSRALGLLLVGPTLLFIANLLTPTPPAVVLAVVVGLAVVCFGVGYLLRTESGPVDRSGPATEPMTD